MSEWRTAVSGEILQRAATMRDGRGRRASQLQVQLSSTTIVSAADKSESVDRRRRSDQREVRQYEKNDSGGHGINPYICFTE